MIAAPVETPLPQPTPLSEAPSSLAPPTTVRPFTTGTPAEPAAPAAPSSADDVTPPGFGSAPAPVPQPFGAPAPTPPASVGPPPSSQPLSLNSVTFEELRSQDLTVTQATRLLAHRERLGGFAAVDDLDGVAGLPPDLLANLKSRATL